MKKRSLLILALVAFTLQTFAAATMQPTGWIWIKDDGDLETATIIGEDYVPATLETQTAIRLRLRIDNMSDSELASTGLGFFTTPATVHFNGADGRLIDLAPTEAFDWATSAVVSDGTPIEVSRDVIYQSTNIGNQQIVFNPGLFVSSSQALTVPKKQYTEVEYCITPTSTATTGTYFFMPKGEPVELWPEASDTESWPTLNYIAPLVSTKNIKALAAKVIATSGSIKLSSLPAGSVKVALVNALGQTVRSSKSADGQLTFATTGMAKGMYIVKIAGMASEKVIIK